MATITINGRKVTVDDSFLSLPPEEQDRTVDEIASQLGAAPEDAPVPPAETPEAEQPGNDALSVARTGVGGLIEGIPVAGPLIRRGVEKAAAATRAAVSDETYDQVLARIDKMNAEEKAANPVVDIGSQLAGGIASMAPVAATATGARLLGITGKNLATRAGMSAASGAAISGADSAARGGNAENIAGSAAIGGAVSGAIPVVGAGLSAAGRAIADRVYPTVNAVRNPTGEAARRVGLALRRDAANPQSIMSNADEAVARQNNIPLLNADRGGETTRALARSVANQSPEARAIIENTASDRFGSQSQRAVDFVRRIAGGNADDLAYQENLRQAATRTNAPAYRAAYDAPAAQQVFTPRIQQLMQSPTFRRAVDRVPTRSADRGAIAGQRALDNPFTTNSRGDYVLRRTADGRQVTPSLEFWDHVQRNLRTFGDKAARAGDNTTASEITALRQALNRDLDAAVPEFQTARAGAASFFGAEDAIDAGRQFVNRPRSVPEARRALQAFTPQERQAFATGFASELIDKIRSSGDRTNVITSVFRNQSARESMELVFGPQRMREIEAYVRVEDLVDRLRGAMGNSTTARQLVELGIGAGGGAYLSGDWTGALAGAAVARGARYAGQRVDARVMENVARLLTSDNRGNLALAVRQAAANPAYMAALERLSNALAVPARVGAQQAVQ